MRTIGKICARIIAIETETGIKYTPKFGELTEERKELIAKAMTNGDSHRYDLRTIEHRYFLSNFTKLTLRKYPQAVLWEL